MIPKNSYRILIRKNKSEIYKRDIMVNGLSHFNSPFAKTLCLVYFIHVEQIRLRSACDNAE